MITQEIKSNINRIDSELKDLFDNVYIAEKSKGNEFYFDINVNTLLLTLEKYGHQRCEVKVKISKSDITKSNIKWSYSTNPLNESSDWIDRLSTIDYIAKDIYEIATKRRMDSSYFEKLEIIVESINENSQNIENPTMSDKIKSHIENYGIRIIKVESGVKPLMEDNSFLNVKSDENYKFFHNQDIKVSDMFKLEMDLKTKFKVDWTLFKEGFIEVEVSFKN